MTTISVRFLLKCNFLMIFHLWHQMFSISMHVTHRKSLRGGLLCYSVVVCLQSCFTAFLNHFWCTVTGGSTPYVVLHPHFACFRKMSKIISVAKRGNVETNALVWNETRPLALYQAGGIPKYVLSAPKIKLILPDILSREYFSPLRKQLIQRGIGRF